MFAVAVSAATDNRVAAVTAASGYAGSHLFKCGAFCVLLPKNGKAGKRKKRNVPFFRFCTATVPFFPCLPGSVHLKKRNDPLFHF